MSLLFARSSSSGRFTNERAKQRFSLNLRLRSATNRACLTAPRGVRARRQTNRKSLGRSGSSSGGKVVNGAFRRFHNNPTAANAEPERIYILLNRTPKAVPNTGAAEGEGPPRGRDREKEEGNLYGRVRGVGRGLSSCRRNSMRKRTRGRRRD